MVRTIPAAVTAQALVGRPGLSDLAAGSPAPVPTRDQVRELLDAGHSCQTAGKELGIPSGLVFMIATGVPADGSDVPSPDELDAKRMPQASTQNLVNPPPFTPTSKPHVMDWVRERAARELEQG